MKQLIDHTFNNGSFTQEQFVYPWQQAIFYIFPKPGNELHTKGTKELFKEWLRNIATIGDQLAKQALAARGHWCAVIDIAGCNLASQEFATVIGDQMQLETLKPAH